MLPSYLFLRVTHLQRSMSRFTRITLIEAAILNPVIPTYQPSVVGNNCLLVELKCYQIIDKYTACHDFMRDKLPLIWGVAKCSSLSVSTKKYLYIFCSIHVMHSTAVHVHMHVLLFFTSHTIQ